MSFGAKAYERLASSVVGAKPWPAASSPWAIQVIAVLDAAYKDAAKERKRTGIHPDAERVYELYPKKVGRDAALVAITKALQKNTVEYLLDKTSQFARCVADWPSSYRYFQDGADRCPHPSTWFNEGRYADDPSTWKRAGARSAPPKVKVDLPEPQGWRDAFPDFIHADKPWHALDAFSQQHIIEHMKERKHA